MEGEDMRAANQRCIIKATFIAWTMTLRAWQDLM